MKKICIALLLCLTGIGAFAQNLTLDEAIQSAATEMGQRLPQGGKVAVLSFTSPAERLSGYVIDELNNAIVNGGKLTVVDRQQLDLIMQEMQFQESGLVSDESAQEIGRLLGAQYIVAGSMELIAGSWRFRTRALTVENASIIYSGSQNVVNNKVITSLTGESGESSGGLSGDFTAAERNRARWLNIFWGAGSFSQRDILGGTITAALEVGGLVCIIIGGVSFLTWTNESVIEQVQTGGGDYSEYGYGMESRPETYITYTYTYDGKTYSSQNAAYDAQDKKFSDSIILASTGVILGVTGIVFGFIRPSFAHRPGYMAGTFADPARWNVALVSDHRGDRALRLSYAMSY
jgi:TolB-like protein